MQVFLTFISIAGSIWLWLVFFRKLKAKNVHWFWSFTLGGVASNFLAALLDEVDMIAGNPDPASLHKWCTSILKDYIGQLYPGLEVKT